MPPSAPRSSNSRKMVDSPSAARTLSRGLVPQQGLLWMVSALACALAVFGCAHRGVPQQPTIAVGNASSESESEATLAQRCLFQVRYRGEDESGRFRLALWTGANRFRLQASDPLGRTAWVFEHSPEKALWLDHRNKTRCAYAQGRDAPDLALKVEEFGALPVHWIPEILTGARDRLDETTSVVRDENGASLTRDAAQVSWREVSCEVADGPWPKLDRRVSWPESCP